MNSFYERVVTLSLCTFPDLSLEQSEFDLQIDDNDGCQLPATLDCRNQNGLTVEFAAVVAKQRLRCLESDQVREMKQLQDENGRLKQLVVELSLYKTMLQDVPRKKW